MSTPIPPDDPDGLTTLRVRKHLRLVYSADHTSKQRMNKLSRSDLYSLEAYSSERKAFRERVLEHKKPRKIHLGAHVTLLFEDRMTIQYQIQEMLRIERIFEAEGINDELSAYNPLIPDGSNLKATMLIEYDDVEVRKVELARLGGIEHRVYGEVEGFERSFAIADEDLDRSAEDKTSAVHFLRFEFSAASIMALRGGATLSFGIDDRRMPLHTTVSAEGHRSLSADFS